MAILLKGSCKRCCSSGRPRGEEGTFRFCPKNPGPFGFGCITPRPGSEGAQSPKKKGGKHRDRDHVVSLSCCWSSTSILLLQLNTHVRTHVHICHPPVVSDSPTARSPKEGRRGSSVTWSTSVGGGMLCWSCWSC